MNQRIVFLTAFSVILFAHLYSQKSELKWQISQVVIDGNENDWNPEGRNLRFYDSQNQVYYDLRNDSTNLYFVAKSDNSFLQQQILRAGMNLKFTIKEKAKRTATFSIEPKKGIPERFSFKKNGEASLDELARKEESFPRDTAFLQGFQFSKTYILSGKNDLNEVSFDISKGRKATKTVFELLVPLRELFGDNYKLNQINQIPLQLQLTVNAPSANSNFGSTRGRMGHRGGFSGGGMMPPGGGMEPGGGMSPGGEMQEGAPSRPDGMKPTLSMEKINMKFEFYLTNKKTP